MIEKLKIEKIDKKSLQYLGVIVVVAIIVCVGFFYYLSLMSKIEMEEKISESREYIYQNKVTSECSSETCWINDEGKKECTATFGKCQWIDDNGTWKDFIDVVNMTFDYNSGDIIYFYKEDYSVTARLFLVVDVSQSVCEAQGWNWRSQDNACFLWWDKAKKFMEANGIDYDVIITEYPDRYKYALSLTKIPQNYQDKLLYVGLRLEEAKGLKWEDLKKQERYLTIKNKISLGFDDLIKNGFTYKLYDERTILIGNVSNKENLWLDPIAGPATETSDGYIKGENTVYSTALSTSSFYSTTASYLFLGQDLYTSGCNGTPTAVALGGCGFYDGECDNYPNGEEDCNNEVIGCYWVGCTGTVPCDNFDDDSYFCNYVGCSWDGCTGTATDCDSFDFINEPTCTDQSGCSWPGCEGTPPSCDGYGSQAECEYHPGCEWIESAYGFVCTGTPDPCDTYDGFAFACGLQGCDWFGCEGTPTSCDSYTSEYPCTSQDDCSWTGCSGADVSCSVFDCSDDCEYFGCSWLACQGTPTPCEDLSSETCESQIGCDWSDELYGVTRSYLEFDTSSIPDEAVITDVKLSLKVSSDVSYTDFDVQIYKFNWAEPITSSNREANYDAGGAVYDADWRNTSGISTEAYYDSSSLDNSWVNKTGNTKYQLRSRRDVNEDEPNEYEYIGFYSADSTGHEPILNIIYTIDIAPPGITITSIGGDSAAPYSTNDNTPLAVITTDENADCRASLLDDNYDLMSDDIDCTGDGGTSHNCQFGSLEDSASQEMHFACKDTLGNKNTNANNKDTTVEIDTTVPTQSGWDPAKGSAIGTKSPTITFILNEEGDCKWSLTDQAYDDMAGDCTGDGGTSMSCSTSGLSEGAEIVYIACEDDTDSSPNKDTAATNEHVNYIVIVNQSPDKPTDLNESWGCCGGTPQVALRTCLILKWSTFDDPDSGDFQQAYEVEINTSPTFNHVANVEGSEYTVDAVNGDDDGDWSSSFSWDATYNWRVKVQDNNDNWSEFSELGSFTMPNRASPTVGFTPNPVSPKTGEEVTFIDDSKCYLSDDSEYDCDTGGDEITYEWDFDYDGSFDPSDWTKGDATYTYPKAGSYVVRLQITDIGVGGPFTGMCSEEVAVGFPLPIWREVTPF